MVSFVSFLHIVCITLKYLYIDTVSLSRFAYNSVHNFRFSNRNYWKTLHTHRILLFSCGRLSIADDGFSFFGFLLG